MRLFLLTFTFFLLIITAHFCFAQNGKDLAAKDKPAAAKPADTPAPPTLDETDTKSYVEVQNAINDVNNRLNKLITTARDGKEKSSAEKAANWTDFELALALGQLNQSKYETWLAAAQRKYGCAGCVVQVAPDQKTLFLRTPQPTPPSAK